MSQVAKPLTIISRRFILRGYNEAYSQDLRNERSLELLLAPLPPNANSWDCINQPERFS